jgi:hypothetical protein
VLYAAAVREPDTEQAQTHLKRAVSTAYYAMFHAVCSSAAELLPGAAGESATSAAWLQAYRGPEHTHVRNQCRNVSIIALYPPEIREFAQTFVEIQGRRNQADYNPLSNFSFSDADRIINRAELAINQLSSTPETVRRAFAITILLRNRAD